MHAADAISRDEEIRLRGTDRISGVYIRNIYYGSSWTEHIVVTFGTHIV